MPIGNASSWRSLRTGWPVSITSSAAVAAAFDASPTGIVIRDADGTSVAWNEAARSILGVTDDQLASRTWNDARWQAVGPDGTPLVPDAHPTMVAMRDGVEVRDAVMGVRTDTGEQRWLQVTVLPLVRRNGHTVLVASYFVDITARWTAERALEASEGRLRLATTAARVGLFDWDVLAGRVSFDDTALSILGDPDLCDMADARARVLELVHPDDRDRAANAIASVSEAHVPIEGEFRLDDGVRLRTILVESAYVAGGTRLLGALIDTTALHDTHNRVVELLETMSDAYMALDEDLRFVYLNAQAEHILGVAREQVLGDVIWEHFPEARGTVFERCYRDVLATGQAAAFEAFYAPLDAWFEVRAHRTAEGLGVYFHDVTTKRQQALEREALLASEQAARREAEATQRRLHHAATYDELTGLLNRRALISELDRRLATSHGRTSELGICYIDLDHFKLVNDSRGHDIGDRVLVEVAARLRAIVGADDCVARLGGDEFVMVLERATRSEILRTAERIIDTLRTSVLDGAVVLTASAGVTVAEPGAGAADLLRDADAALYRAKDRGRNHVAIFDDDVRRAVIARVEMEADLRAALTRREIRPHYQPIFSLESGRVRAVEALARWRHETRGAVPPVEFIPVAEETGMIVDLGRQILTVAASDAEATAAALDAPGLTTWVNVAPLQLQQPHFRAQLLGDLSELDVDPSRIGIEITESALNGDDAQIARTIRALSDDGIRIAIDDFGTGYSSLARVHEYPVDAVKIDRSFIQRLGGPAPAPLVAAITEVAHALGAVVCAEGVETVEQLEILHGLGVDLASGYLLAPPMPLEELGSSRRNLFRSGAADLGV